MRYLKELETQNQKAELNVRASQLGYQDSVDKSNEAAVRQAQARSEVSALQGQADAKAQELADLTAAISGEAQNGLEKGGKYVTMKKESSGLHAANRM